MHMFSMEKFKSMALLLQVGWGGSVSVHRDPHTAPQCAFCPLLIILVWDKGRVKSTFNFFGAVHVCDDLKLKIESSISIVYPKNCHPNIFRASRSTLIYEAALKSVSQ